MAAEKREKETDLNYRSRSEREREKRREEKSVPNTLVFAPLYTTPDLQQ